MKMVNIEELKSLAQLMTERFSMNPVSSQILSESWINAFPDEPAIAHKFLALIAQLEAAQKERDTLQQKLKSFSESSEKMKMQRIRELEAELSAANEKLSKPVVLDKYWIEPASHWHEDEETMPVDEIIKAIKAAGFVVEDE